jgi:hypothetical protein
MVVPLVGAVAKFVWVVVWSVILLSLCGVDTSSLAVILGSFTIAVGFASTDIAKCMVGLMVLLAEAPFVIGDWIIINDKYAGKVNGRVQEINFRSTVVCAWNKERICIPNSLWLNKSIRNLSKSKMMLIKLNWHIAHGQDMSVARGVCAKLEAWLHTRAKTHGDIEVGAAADEEEIWPKMSDIKPGAAECPGSIWPDKVRGGESASEHFDPAPSNN